jgi:aryl-alcohol dehydrogenase-like predicted oxidoreductase
METRAYGKTGLTVSVLGFGAGQIGEDSPGEGSLDEKGAARLLGEVLDLGVTLVDTARSYGLSEERIGRHLAHRRGDFVLSTKGGYGVDGVADWTGEVITRGIEDALRRLRTDWIDVFHLHSCPRDVLERGEVTRALEDARSQGKIRVAAYSGDNDALAWAARSEVFGAIQCSLNVSDQDALASSIPAAAERGLGVIAKRPIANAAWRFAERPAGDYAEVYWERLRAMQLDRGGIDWPDYALRFSAYAPGVSSVIVGTKRIEHLRANAELVARGALPGALVDAARAAFERCAREAGGWPGEV